jgi:hypothetical protein
MQQRQQQEEEEKRAGEAGKVHLEEGEDWNDEDLREEERAIREEAEEEEEEEKEQEEAAAPTTALRTPGEKALLGALTLLPPLGFAVGDPSIFFSALDNGGTYGVMTLFGILPAAMAWAQRYGEGRDPDTAFAEEALPGGKLTLLAMIAAGAAFVSVETWERIEALT